MRTARTLPQEPFETAVRDAEERLHARCRHCPLPPAVARVQAWDPETWIEVWSDAADTSRRRAGLALNAGETGEAFRGYWLAAFCYETATRFLNGEADPRFYLLTTAEAACRRMAAILGGDETDLFLEPDRRMP